MPTYISLLRFTEKGASNIKKSTGRASAFAKAAARTSAPSPASNVDCGDPDQ